MFGTNKNIAETITTTDTRYGPMNYYSQDTFIGNALFLYGEYSRGEPDLWSKFLKPGDHCIDIGANIGVFSLALSDIVGDTGHVVAIEASDENFALLKKNTASRSNIITAKIVLSDKDGDMVVVPAFECLPHTNFGGVEVRGDLNDPDLAGTILMTSTLDKNLAHNHKIAFIKIDVEGMEAKVLRGAKSIIDMDRPVLYVENDRAEKSDELTKLLLDYGYSLYVHRPTIYSANNFKHVRQPPTPQIVSLNLLCVPKERDEEFRHNGIVDGLELVFAPIPALDHVTIPEDTPQRMGPVLSVTPTPSEPAAQKPEPVKKDPPKKIKSKDHWACVVRLGGIGDNLIAASVLRPLKEQGYKIEVISQDFQAAVFENNPFVDRLSIKSPNELPQNDPIAWQKYWWSRSREYAKFVNLSHSVEVLLAQFAQSTAFWWSPEYRRKMCSQSYLEAAHDIVGVPYQFGSLYFPTEIEAADIANFKKRHGLDKKPLIAWVISGTRVDKLYPFAAMAIARILAEVDCNVIMLSAPSPERPDAAHAEQIMNHVRLTNSTTTGLYEARHVAEAHDWSLRRILNLAMQADLVIGPDTGVMWSVAMEGMTKIMLHSHASADNITKHWTKTVSLLPDQTKVPCWPCHLLHDGIETCQEEQIRNGREPNQDDLGAACISNVSVRQVVLAVKGALGSLDALSQLQNEYGNQVILRGATP